ARVWRVALDVAFPPPTPMMDYTCTWSALSKGSTAEAVPAKIRAGQTSTSMRRSDTRMAEYTVGRATTRKRKQSTCNIHLTVKPAVFARLQAMQRALQMELGDDITITMATIVRRILYQHPALKHVARRHYAPPEDGGDSLVR